MIDISRFMQVRVCQQFSSKQMLALLLSSTIFIPATASAQVTENAVATPSPLGNQLQDIVVTARKREESLMSVPVAVTALSAETISQSGATNLEQIAQLAPQVQIMRASSGSGGIISIRGLGTPALDAGLDQSVSINIDGVQAGRGNIISQGFFDLQQVEVLKGPQALFFGKNSPAGVIALRSVNPTDQLEAFVKAGYEFEAHQYYGEAAIGGPLTDTLKARIAVRGSRMRGWMKNTAVDLPNNPFYPGLGSFAGPKSNGGKELIGRATMVFTPSNDFDATLKVSGGTFKDNGPTSQAFCPTKDFATANGFVAVLPDTNGDCRFDDTYQSAGISPRIADRFAAGGNGGKPYTDTKSTLTSLTMNYNLPDLTITSVTGYMTLKLTQGSSFSYTSYALTYGAIVEDTTQFSQEIRAVSNYDGPLNFTFGGFYEHLKRDSQVNILFGGSNFGPDPVTGNYHTYDNLAANRGETISGFGQLRWRITDQFELSGGVRYTHETKNTNAVNRYLHAVTGPVFGVKPQGVPVIAKFSDSNWSPELTLSWTPMDGTLVYVAYKTGYKSGGISNPSRLSAISTPADLLFDSESSKGGEIGFKSYLADRTVRIEAAAYSYLYKNLQVSAFDQLAQMSFLTNAGTARIKGLELQGEWNVARGFKLNGSSTYNLARYKSFNNAICYLGQTAATGCINGQRQDLSGFPLTRAPKWTFSAGANYDVALASSLMIGLNGNATYSASYYTAEDHHPLTIQKSFTLFNVGARLYDTASGWELAVIGRNLANKHYLKLCNGLGSPTQFGCGNVRGREMTVQGTYRF